MFVIVNTFFLKNIVVGLELCHIQKSELWTYLVCVALLLDFRFIIANPTLFEITTLLLHQWSQYTFTHFKLLNTFRLLQCVPRKGFGSTVVTLCTLSIYPSVHYQLILSLLEAHIVAWNTKKNFLSLVTLKI